MAVKPKKNSVRMESLADQTVTDRYAIYNADCIELMATLPDECVGLSLYSPPFCGLYNYSSSVRDLSNCSSYKEFFTHYEFVVREIHRLTQKGRMTAVHCADIRVNGANLGGGLVDFSGDIIRLHQTVGFEYVARYSIWKEPLGVRNRTMSKSLAHQQIIEDSSLCDNAAADYLLVFRRKGENRQPIRHPNGLMDYAGEREIPHEIRKLRGYTGKQTENRYSHWIWRQYASAFWDDIRIDRVLPYKASRDPEDERHVHPLQLDVIDRVCVLWSNPDDVVLSPFAGVGSEVYGAVVNGRRGVGIELKSSYYRQMQRNLYAACKSKKITIEGFFGKS